MMKKVTKLVALSAALVFALTAIACDNDSSDDGYASSSTISAGKIKDFKATVLEGAIYLSWIVPDGKSPVEVYRYNTKEGAKKMTLDASGACVKDVYSSTNKLVDGETYTYVIVNKGLYNTTSVNAWLKSEKTGTNSVEGAESIIAKTSVKAKIPAKLGVPEKKDFYIDSIKDGWTGTYTHVIKPYKENSLYTYKYRYCDKETGNIQNLGPSNNNEDIGFQFPFTVEVTRAWAVGGILDSDPLYVDFDFEPSFVRGATVALNGTYDVEAKSVILDWDKKDGEVSYKLWKKDTRKFENWISVEGEQKIDPTDDKKLYVKIPVEEDKTAYNIDYLIVAEANVGKVYGTTTVSVASTNITFTLQPTVIENKVVFTWDAISEVAPTIYRSETGNVGTWDNITSKVEIKKQKEQYGISVGTSLPSAVAYQVSDNTLEKNKTYLYKVVQGISVVTSTNPVGLTATTSFPIDVSYANKGVRLAWTSPKGDYNVYRAESIGTGTGIYIQIYPQISTPIASGNEFFYSAWDTSVVADKKYKYYVVAKNDKITNAAATSQSSEVDTSVKTYRSFTNFTASSAVAGKVNITLSGASNVNGQYIVISATNKTTGATTKYVPKFTANAATIDIPAGTYTFSATLDGAFTEDNSDIRKDNTAEVIVN